MDIFGRKRIKELERKLYAAERDRDRYSREAAELAVEFRAMGELKETVPEDCVRGPWCEACEFVKKYYYVHEYGLGMSNTKAGYMCSKGKSCNNFVQKENKE